MDLINTYSPFTNEKNEMIYIEDITFKNLSQLKEKEIEESFQIEYKVDFNTEVKNKIPKVITSFANDHGGWLFIGIENNTRNINLLPKMDYEIQINQILNSNTSPSPFCFIRFIHEETDESKGIIVIWVPEGENPPYIAKGKIYQRSGSSSEPIKDIEDRYYLDTLYQKSQNNKEKIKSFCKKEISITNRFQIRAIPPITIDRGICNLYFIPRIRRDIRLNYDIDGICEFVLKESKKAIKYSKNGSSDEFSLDATMPFEKFMASPESLIFRNTKQLEAYEKTTGFELYLDLSAKFHCPLQYLDKNQGIFNIQSKLVGLQDAKILEDFQYVNGFDLIARAFSCIGLYNHILSRFNKQSQEFMLIIELTDIEKNVLYFESPKYFSFLSKYGLMFSDKKKIFIPFGYTYSKFDLKDPFPILYTLFTIWNSFGIRGKEGIPFFIEEAQLKQQKKD